MLDILTFITSLFYYVATPLFLRIISTFCVNFTPFLKSSFFLPFNYFLSIYLLFPFYFSLSFSVQCICIYIYIYIYIYNLYSFSLFSTLWFLPLVPYAIYQLWMTVTIVLYQYVPCKFFSFFFTHYFLCLTWIFSLEKIFFSQFCSVAMPFVWILDHNKHWFLL